MIAGSTPTEAWLSTTPSGSRPSSAARRADIRITAAAPSLIDEALPAVTVPPSRRNAARSFARLVTVVPGRGPSSASTMRVPRLSGTSTGTISSLNTPLASARSAFC